MGENIGKKISEILRAKCSQKLFDHAKQSATDALKTTSKRVIQKTTEANGDLISTSSRMVSGTINDKFDEW